jgi:hypothetical protein
MRHRASRLHQAAPARRAEHKHFARMDHLNTFAAELTVRAADADHANSFRVRRSPLRSTTMPVNVPPISDESRTRDLTSFMLMRPFN